ncbi:MAG: chemotaxis protein CheD [Clostridia bacterium]|nr:chemotaxis protein CheD [Clostridia bacterium]
MGNLITVGISDLKIASGDDILITYALGSCIGTCLFDPVSRIIGLSHILLPTVSACPHDTNIYKFADTAINELVRIMKANGASVYRMSAKIAGGAQMFINSTNRIGDKNRDSVIASLNLLGIKITGSDVGDSYGRTMECHADGGRVLIKSINKITKVL